jgi:hypothetical protein
MATRKAVLLGRASIIFQLYDGKWDVTAEKTASSTSKWPASAV